MSWLAILLTLAALGGNPASHHAKPRKHCTAAAKHCKAPKSKPKPKKMPTKPRAETPSAQPTPQATPAPTVVPGASATPEPSVTPAPPGTYPTRTGVDLSEWRVRSSYLTLAAGRIDFNATNLGEDDHNLSVRGGGKDYGKLDLSPGDSGTLTLELGLGTYTLYCSLPDHEAAGMHTEISVR